MSDRIKETEKSIQAHSKEDDFPWLIAAVNAALLVILYMIYTADLIGVIIRLFECGFLLSVIIPLQYGIWKGLQRFFHNSLGWSIFLLLPAMLLAVYTAYVSLPATKAERTLNDGRLSKLPVSATDVRNAGWASLFSGESLLAFRADPQDIERFLATSPSLRGTEVKKYSGKYQRVPYPKDDAIWDTERYDYFYPDPAAPDWWKEEIREKGRSYEIPPDARSHNGGEVLYNEKTNTVFIRVVWS